jgi:hypothetical protein
MAWSAAASSARLWPTVCEFSALRYLRPSTTSGFGVTAFWHRREFADAVALHLARATGCVLIPADAVEIAH